MSRKDNPSDFGLPGGKIEDGEQPFIAMVREMVEETSFSPVDAELFEVTEHQGYQLHTFTCSGVMKTTEVALELGVVAWVRPEVLTKGSFGKYNQRLILTLIERGLYES